LLQRRSRACSTATSRRRPIQAHLGGSDGALIVARLRHTQDLKHTIDQSRSAQPACASAPCQATSDDTSTLEGQLANFNANAILEQIQEARKGGQNLAALLVVQGQERQKIIDDFGKQAIAAEQQIADERMKRIQSAQDRLFAATNDATTLEGQLAAFDRQAAKERLDEANAGGQAMVDLLAAQQAEELNLRKSFSDKVLEETKRSEKERLDALNQAAVKIVDYINSINVGTESGLSPGARLSTAQSTFNNIFALAQGGNVDALSRITQDAENLRKALQAVYASGSGYQTGWASIQSQLRSLGAIPASTDPIVAALSPLSTIVTNTEATATNVDNLDASGSVLASIDAFTSRVVNAINNHGSMSQSAFTNLSDHLAHIRGYTGWAATHNAGSGSLVTGVTSVDGTIGGWSYTAAAKGGVIPPFGLGLVSEHLNPTWVRAGAEPITVTPNNLPRGANDNGDVVAELRALRSDLADAKREIAALRQDTRDGADKVTKSVDGVAEIEDRGWKRASGAAGRG
jgi:hypothetical protein